MDTLTGRTCRPSPHAGGHIVQRAGSTVFTDQLGQDCRCLDAIVVVVSRSVVSNSFATLWTVACQAPLSMEFSRQEYWSGFPFPTPGDLLYPGIKPRSPALQGGSLPLSHQGGHEILWMVLNSSLKLSL